MQIAARLRGKLDGLKNFVVGDVLGYCSQRNVCGDQRDAEPAVPIIAAEQHHRGAGSFGNFGKEFCLADEKATHLDDALFIYWGSDDAVEFAGEGTPRALSECGHG